MSVPSTNNERPGFGRFQSGIAVVGQPPVALVPFSSQSLHLHTRLNSLGSERGF